MVFNIIYAILSLISLSFQPTVDIMTVLSQLMDRLSNYATSSTEVSFPMHLFSSRYAFKDGFSCISCADFARISSGGSFC